MSGLLDQPIKPSIKTPVYIQYPGKPRIKLGSCDVQVDAEAQHMGRVWVEHDGSRKIFAVLNHSPPGAERVWVVMVTEFASPRDLPGWEPL